MTDKEMNMTDEALSPCPFCGGAAERIDIEEGEDAGGSCISCTQCLATGPLEFGFKENFISNWNRRALTAPALAVMAERQRQIAVEGWTPERDDRLVSGALGLAAALYAIPYEAMLDGRPLIGPEDYISLQLTLHVTCDFVTKPEPDLRRRLIKAGALILAEIERLDRMGDPQ